MLKVGIVIPEEISPTKNKKTSWLGGLNYYKNVISAVYKLPDRKIDIVVFVNSNASNGFVQQFSGFEIVKTPVVDLLNDKTFKLRRPLLKIWFYILTKLKHKNYLLEKLLTQHNVDVYCYGDPLFSKTIKSVCWIADFQQINHPEFFTTEEVALRNAHINSLIEKSDSIILSSETALNDLKRYMPEFAHKANVLKFIPAIDFTLQPVPLKKLEEKYGFSGGYFYLPNQFWKHKNHQVVVRAVNEIINVQNKKILILASGSLNDYRSTQYIDNVVGEISAGQLSENIKLLGVIPYIDVLSLMHYSLALINPSYSEGWSSTVEEAKQLNIPLILSSIQIHQEQTITYSKATLFDPDDHYGLANILINFCVAANKSSHFNNNHNFDSLQNEFALTYQDIIVKI